MKTKDVGLNRKLRVVFVDHIARLSGGEIALLRLLPALSTEVEIHVILGEDGPLVGRLEALGIETEVLPLSPRVRDLRKGTVRPSRIDLRALVQLPSYILRLRRRLHALDADIVHTNSLKAALYAGTAARIAGLPVVWHVRDRIATDYLPRSAIALVRIAARILPTIVVANSRSTLATVPRTRRGTVLNNPIVPDSIDLRRRRRRVDAGEFVVGVVGRLAPWKGQHIFLDGFAEAFKGTSVRGRIIGSAMFGEDTYADSLKQQAKRLGVSDQIEFRGFRENIWAELGELDILVHCSVTPEPFGQVVLEGMAAGVPVIAAAAGGPSELITSGVNGILTMPDDSDGLAAALRRLHDDPGLCTDLASAARRRSREFTPERAAELLVGIYNEIVPRS